MSRDSGEQRSTCGPGKETGRLTVIVKPRSSRREVKVEGDALVVRVTAPPVGGKANEMCLAVLAEWLGVPKSQLSILGGARQRRKTIVVAGLGQAEVEKRLREGAG